jgi:ketosteroid isomerase-like protein
LVKEFGINGAIPVRFYTILKVQNICTSPTYVKKMNMKLKFILKVSIALLFLIAFSMGCTEPRTNGKASLLEDAKAAIAASNAIYFSSFEKNDSVIFIDRYTEDACLMGGNAPKKCGKEKIAEFFRSAYNDGLRSGDFVTLAVYGLGDEYVVEEGTGRTYFAEGKLKSEGKHLVLWKKTAKGWKMFRDSFSGDKPPAK